MSEQLTVCVGGDPLCPCQDGDACHYREVAGTPAWPLPEPATHRCAACDHPDASKRDNGAWLCDECAADLVTIPAEEFGDA